MNQRIEPEENSLKQAKIQQRIKANRIIGAMKFRDHFCLYPGKHSWDLCGHPLYYWKLKAAAESRYLEKIVLFTEVEEAWRIAREMSDKFIIIERKIEECKEPEWKFIDNLKTPHSRVSVYKSSLRQIVDEIFYPESVTQINLEANSPLETSASIDKLIEAYFADDLAETAHLAYEVEGFLWTTDPQNLSYFLPVWEFHTLRDRSKFPPLYRRGGSSIETYMEVQQRHTILVEIPREEGVDIHDEKDLALARFYLTKRLRGDLK